MPHVTRFCDCGHERDGWASVFNVMLYTLEAILLVIQNVCHPGRREKSAFGRGIAPTKNSIFLTVKVVRNDKPCGIATLSPARIASLSERGSLLCEPVGLGDGAHGDSVVNVEATGVEGLAVEIEQSRILDLGFQHGHRGCRRQALGLFQ